MAKAIKFNLVCDGAPVRTIEDLQNNFSIEDVLAYYSNRLLHRWLEVRGYTDELEKVNAITSEDELDIIKTLVRIFDVERNEEDIERGIYILQYSRDHRAWTEDALVSNQKAQNLVEGYIKNYRSLTHTLFTCADDRAAIGAALREIAEDYLAAFNMDYRHLVLDLLDCNGYLAVMCILMNEKLREYCLPLSEELITEEDGEKYDRAPDVVERDARNELYEKICKVSHTEEFYTALGDNLRRFSGKTNEYWKDLEPKGKKYMILTISNGDYVRASGDTGGDLSMDDVANQFRILDGIDYKSNSDSHRIQYLEV